MNSETYLMYTDESGSGGFTVHSSVLVPVRRWQGVLTTWLRYRKWLLRSYDVPKTYNLHMAQWIKAKDTPVADQPQAVLNRSENIRRETAHTAVKTIANSEVRVVTTVAKTPVVREAYVNHLTTLDRLLQDAGDWGLVVVDGPYANAEERLSVHRELILQSRRIVEDAWVQPAAKSQLVQMSDIVAHCAFQSLHRNQAREFMWDWYPEHFHDREWDGYCACPQ